MAYHIIINEYQRAMLQNLLANEVFACGPNSLTPEAGESRAGYFTRFIVGDPGHRAFPESHLHEMETLSNMLKEMPEVEKANPGITHGLCL